MKKDFVAVFEYTESASCAYRGLRFMRIFESEDQFSLFRTDLEARDRPTEKIYAIDVTRQEGERLCAEALTTEKVFGIGTAESDESGFKLSIRKLMNLQSAKLLPEQEP